MRLFNFRKKKNAAENLQSFSNVNAASLNIPVHADSEPFASDNDINNFTKAIGDEYVSKKKSALQTAQKCGGCIAGIIER